MHISTFVALVAAGFTSFAVQPRRDTIMALAVVTSTTNAGKESINSTFAAKDVFALGAATFLFNAVITYFVVAVISNHF